MTPDALLPAVGLAVAVTLVALALVAALVHLAVGWRRNGGAS